MSDTPRYLEFERDGVMFRVEAGKLRIRRGMCWYDMASYLKRFGEPEREAKVIPFRRARHD